MSNRLVTFVTHKCFAVLLSCHIFFLLRKLTIDRWWIGCWQWFSRWTAIHHIELWKPTINHSFPDRYGPAWRASSQRQTMDKPRWNEKKHVEGAERKKLLGTSPTVFLFNLGPAVRAAALFLHLFTKHERKPRQKKACRRPTNLLPTLPRSYKDE